MSSSASITNSAFKVAQRQARQRLADAAVHASFGEWLGKRLQRLGGGVDLVAILSRYSRLEPRVGEKAARHVRLGIVEAVVEHVGHVVVAEAVGGLDLDALRHAGGAL